MPSTGNTLQQAAQGLSALTELPPVSYELIVSGKSEPAWRVQRVNVNERLSEPYNVNLVLRTPEFETGVTDLLGTSAALVMQRESIDGLEGAIDERRLSGIVHEAKFNGTVAGYDSFTITLAPAVCALQQQSNCRIFQDMAAPQVIESVLSAGLFPWQRKVRLALTKSYPMRIYCVQYRETDYDFSCRVMAANGITFYFDQSDSTETVVLVDDPAAYPFVPLPASNNADGDGGSPRPVLTAEGPSRLECVHNFDLTVREKPTNLVVRQFDWTQPLLKHDVTSSVQNSKGRQKELYVGSLALPNGGSTPDAQLTQAQGDGLLAAHRLEAQKAKGTSNVLAFTPGYVFEAQGSTRSDMDRRYVITEVTTTGVAVDMHPFTGGSRSAGADDGGLGASLGGGASKRGGRSSQPLFGNTFACMPADSPVAQRIAKREAKAMPIQTAIVVGPQGEEVFTDEHGRVKIKFHWDRTEASNEACSCWVRVAQSWAGQSFGASFLPRVGMEVVVAFIDGDPDQPIITGCVYNGANMTPYPLPQEKTKTVLRTKSSPGGQGYNELSFEDTAGKEQVYIRAQKDLREQVLGSLEKSVGMDETITVTGSQRTEVGAERLEVVKGDRNEVVEGNATTTIRQASTVAIDGDLRHSVGKSMSVNVGGNTSVSLAGSLAVEAAKAVSADFQDIAMLTIQGATEVRSAGAMTLQADADLIQGTGGNHEVTAEGDHILSATGDARWGADGALSVEGCDIRLTAGESLVLEAGGAKISFKGGDIVIKGGNVMVESGGTLAMKSSKITQN